jgi:putative DNA methylase
MDDTPRLIEHAFPLKQASLTSVHEKNVRHGHISTLHIWPARRPLAACRAALIATLLPDPGTPEKRRELCERIGGLVIEKIERKKMPDGKIVERVREGVEDGILSWIGTEPKSGSKKKKAEHRATVEHREKELQWFRDEIRKACGGRVPRVLDPFAGGGAIPLEAMRLGCETTAVDINPVAWFILKCTLEYPQKLAGKTHPLPDFILEDEQFMEGFYRAHPHLVGRTKKTKKQTHDEKDMLPGFASPDSGRVPKADLAWHVRAWGRWVLNGARKELAPFYPTYADFEPTNMRSPKPYEPQEMQLVPLKDDGTPAVDALNAEFSEEYLADKKSPRWVAKPTVAYLWARTVTCKNCRAAVPLLKTRWLCKKDRKRVLLTMEPNTDSTGVDFGIQDEVPVEGSNTAQRREHDKRIGAGTMSRAGAQCPCCPAIMTMEDIKVAGQQKGLSSSLTAIIYEDGVGKGYRAATELESSVFAGLQDLRDEVSDSLPFGLPSERISSGSIRKGGVSITRWGMDTWDQLFTSRQLVALGTVCRHIRAMHEHAAFRVLDRPSQTAVHALLSCTVGKLADYNSALCTWHTSRETMTHVFVRYALPITWDFAECNPLSTSSGNYLGCVEWVARYVEHVMPDMRAAAVPHIRCESALKHGTDRYDIVITDPPYYDAIPYSDIMDFFYVWHKRCMAGLSPECAAVYRLDSCPKWDPEQRDGELVQDESRFGGDNSAAKAAYEDGMAGVFAQCHGSLADSGRLVLVFANKQPEAWETLVSAIIRAGFIVDGSWPIQTEMGNRTRALSAAALASSVWLICKKRALTARPGWDNRVMEEMRGNITERLRDFWDAGIRGPDFVWAATGPALEAYSKHPVVKKANAPGQIMTVGEFLVHVRRMVVDFVVGQVLSGEQDGDAAAADCMDSPTAYYLLHRHDFGLDEAPAGACILYATACGISDRDLEATWDLVATKGGSASAEEVDDIPDTEDSATEDSDSKSGSKVKLKTWQQRKGRNMGYDAPSGRPIPLVDRVHRLMHLWRAGDVHRVDEYLDDNGLRRHELFKRLVQSLIELSERSSEERALLESLSNHIGARGAVRDDSQPKLAMGEEG